MIIVNAASSPILRMIFPLKRKAVLKTSRRFTTSEEHPDKEWPVSKVFQDFSCNVLSRKLTKLSAVFSMPLPKQTRKAWILSPATGLPRSGDEERDSWLGYGILLQFSRFISEIIEVILHYWFILEF
ncbi:MAG: hypothetical protein ABIP82_06205 [Nitrospirales bacterium]